MVKKLLTGLIVATFLLATAGISDAATIWKTVTLQFAGVNGTNVLVKATDTAAPPAFTGRSYLLNAATANTMLATALSAIAAGKTVQLALPSLTEWSVVSAIYMNSN